MDEIYRAAPETLRSGGLIRHLASDGGGQVATALVAGARLGACTALLGVTGADERGAAIRRGLEAEQVDIAGLSAVAGRSAGGIVLVDADGERRILYEPATAPERELTDDDRARISAADGLLLERDTPFSVACARAAQRASVPVLLDLDVYVGEPAALELRPTIVIMSEAAAARHGVETTQRCLIERGTEVAIVTRGQRGAIARTASGEVVEVPAEPANVVDTTGAGDAYHGAFMTSWCAGATLTEAMVFAARVAAINCEQQGGRAGIPSRSDLVQRYPHG